MYMKSTSRDDHIRVWQVKSAPTIGSASPTARLCILNLNTSALFHFCRIYLAIKYPLSIRKQPPLHLRVLPLLHRGGRRSF